MEIRLDHRTDKLTAVRKIDSFLDGLMSQEFPNGVTIKNPQKQWIQDRMDFSFKAKKGMLLGVTIHGTICVSDTAVFLDSDLPGLVTTFVDESKIREVITKQFNELFGLN